MGCGFSMQDVLDEVKSLLFWSMLAASTVGPGTVIMCSKSGSEFGLQLLWALLVASVVAYTMQEGSARLSIVSGLDFGQAMQSYFGRDGGVCGTGVRVCTLLAIGIAIGNQAYEANNFVGAMSSLYLLLPETALLRVGGSVALGLTSLLTLTRGRPDSISEALGWIVLLMVGLFAAAAAAIGLAGAGGASAFFRGALVPAVPPGAGVTVLSLMGTTAIPFNIFLSSSCAEGYSLASMRRGVAFATFMTLVLSSVIVIVGTKVTLATGELFTVAAIGTALRGALGDQVQSLFAGGLFAAAFSSALAVALGVAIACRSLVAPPESAPAQDPEQDLAERTTPTPRGGQGPGGDKDVANRQPNKRRRTLRERHPSLVGDNIEKVDEAFEWSPKGRYYQGVMAAILLVSVIVSASGANTVEVVLTAQIVNGCLLPFVATCLLLLMNEPRFMRERPQTATENVLLLCTVGITIFCASFVVVENLTKLFGPGGPKAETDNVIDKDTTLFVVAGVVTALLMVPLTINTVSKARAAAEARAAAGGVRASEDDDGAGGERAPLAGGEPPSTAVAVRREDSLEVESAAGGGYGSTY